VDAGRGDDPACPANPIAGYVFTRLTGIERRLEAASEQFSPFKKQDGVYVRDDNGNRIPENSKRAALLEDWLWSTLHPDNVAAEILTKVEHLDPSPELQVTAGTEGTDPGAPETWVN
jgi:hypothetical protein